MLSGVEPFVIDQVQTVAFPGDEAATALRHERAERFRAELDALGRTAGFLADDVPASCLVPPGADA